MKRRSFIQAATACIAGACIVPLKWLMPKKPAAIETKSVTPVAKWTPVAGERIHEGDLVYVENGKVYRSRIINDDGDFRYNGVAAAEARKGDLITLYSSYSGPAGPTPGQSYYTSKS